MLSYFFLLPAVLIPPPALPLPTSEAAVLLVLLPLADAGAACLAMLADLQWQLGAAIQVLRLDAATHPAAVHSFDGRGLPAFVLMRHGVELWHQQGLPDGPGVAALLLSKLLPAPAAPEKPAKTTPVPQP